MLSFLGTGRPDGFLQSWAFFDESNIPAVLSSSADPRYQSCVDSAIKLLFARSEARAHALLETAILKLLAKSVSFLDGRERGNETIQEVHMPGEVVCCVPLNAANVWRGWHGWTLAREMPSRIGCYFIQFLGIGYDIRVVQEDPENFFGDTNDFIAPSAVRARVVD